MIVVEVMATVSKVALLYCLPPPSTLSFIYSVCSQIYMILQSPCGNLFRFPYNYKATKSSLRQNIAGLKLSPNIFWQTGLDFATLLIFKYSWVPCSLDYQSEKNLMMQEILGEQKKNSSFNCQTFSWVLPNQATLPAYTLVYPYAVQGEGQWTVSLP